MLREPDKYGDLTISHFFLMFFLYVFLSSHVSSSFFRVFHICVHCQPVFNELYSTFFFTIWGSFFLILANSPGTECARQPLQTTTAISSVASAVRPCTPHQHLIAGAHVLMANLWYFEGLGSAKWGIQSNGQWHKRARGKLACAGGGGGVVGAPRRRGGGPGNGAPVTESLVKYQSPRREVVRSSTGVGVVYPPFLGSFT